MLSALLPQEKSLSCHRLTNFLSETEASLAMIEFGFFAKIKHHACPKLFPNTFSPSVPTPNHSITVQTFGTVKSTTAEQKKRTSLCQKINRLHVRTENTALMFRKLCMILFFICIVNCYWHSWILYVIFIVFSTIWTKRTKYNNCEFRLLVNRRFLWSSRNTDMNIYASHINTVHIHKRLRICTGPPREGSGIGEKCFSGPPARADSLKIFTLNRKE